MRLHVGGASHLIRMTAASIEPQLDPRAFIRIHRRYIVNVDRIVEVQPWFAGDAIVVLRNGAKLRLSRTYRERLHARLGARKRGCGRRPLGLGAAGAGLRDAKRERLLDKLTHLQRPDLRRRKPHVRQRVVHRADERRV